MKLFARRAIDGNKLIELRVEEMLRMGIPKEFAERIIEARIALSKNYKTRKTKLRCR